LSEEGEEEEEGEVEREGARVPPACFRSEGYSTTASRSPAIGEEREVEREGARVIDAAINDFLA
jgi:hypothetical protein